MTSKTGAIMMCAKKNIGNPDFNRASKSPGVSPWDGIAPGL